MMRLRSRLAIAALVLFAFAIVPTRADAQWALLTHTAKESPGGGTVTTNAIDTTGATLIVVVGASNNLNTVLLITDSATNTNKFYTHPTGVSGATVQILLIPHPITSATHTFTMSGSFPSLAVAAFSGSYGGMESLKGTTATGNVTPGSLTPSSDNALVLLAMCNGTTGANSVNVGFTITDIIGGGGAGQRVGLAYLIQTAAAAANPTWTLTGGTSAAQIVDLLLRPSASSGNSRSRVVNHQ